MGSNYTSTPLQSGYQSTQALNNEFQKIEDALNRLLSRYGDTPNDMQAPLDMNSFPILNITVDPNDPESLVTVEFLNQETGKLYDEVDRLDDRVDDERDQRQAADANLQRQISETDPLEASAFSEISWHGQVVENSVTIPENKNAWSFGPTMSIAAGQEVTIGQDSFWTIANGELQQ